MKKVKFSEDEKKGFHLSYTLLTSLGISLIGGTAAGFMLIQEPTYIMYGILLGLGTALVLVGLYCLEKSE